MFSNPDAAELYKLLRGCDQIIMMIPLWTPSRPMLRSTISKFMAIIEGLWSFYLGSFTRKPEWLAMRRAYGQRDVGKNVKGASSSMES